MLATRPGSTRVLIVDDDVQVRSPLAILLEAEGSTVFQASDGKLSQAHCKTGGLELVTTDLVMPE